MLLVLHKPICTNIVVEMIGLTLKQVKIPEKVQISQIIVPYAIILSTDKISHLNLLLKYLGLMRSIALLTINIVVG